MELASVASIEHCTEHEFHAWVIGEISRRKDSIRVRPMEPLYQYTAHNPSSDSDL